MMKLFFAALGKIQVFTPKNVLVKGKGKIFAWISV